MMNFYVCFWPVVYESAGELSEEEFRGTVSAALVETGRKHDVSVLRCSYKSGVFEILIYGKREDINGAIEQTRFQLAVEFGRKMMRTGQFFKSGYRVYYVGKQRPLSQCREYSNSLHAHLS